MYVCSVCIVYSDHLIAKKLQEVVEYTFAKVLGKTKNLINCP